MPDEQIEALEKLFDEQIKKNKKEAADMNSKLKRKLMNDKQLIKLFHDYKDGEISEEQLTKKQIAQIEFLYDMEIERINSETLEINKKIKLAV